MIAGRRVSEFLRRWSQALGRWSCLAIMAMWLGLTPAIATERTITRDELRTGIDGYWIGQLAGDFVGFPFENIYQEEPLPVLADRYYTYKDAMQQGLKVNTDDRRGYMSILADALGGAWSDDDSDIEFVYLHGVELYGLEFDYSQDAGSVC